MNTNIKHDQWLVIWCFVYIIIYVFLCYLHPVSYQTIDSFVYLENAAYLRSLFVLGSKETGELFWENHFPPGYPFCIALISFILPLPHVIISKIINVVAILTLVIGVRKVFNNRSALLIAMVFLSGTFLKIALYTWSEALFLATLFIWVIAILKKESFWKIFFLGVFLISIRYAGIFIIGCVLFLPFSNHLISWSKAILLSLSWLACLIGWSWVNFYQTGYFFGETRFSESISLATNLLDFIQGLLSELFWFRKWVAQDILVYVGAFLQIVLGFILGKRIEKNDAFSTEKRTFVIVGLAYLIALFLIRWYSPFSIPNSRLLSPLTLMLAIAAVNWVIWKENKSTNWLIVCLTVGVSWLDLVPYELAEEKLRAIFIHLC